MQEVLLVTKIKTENVVFIKTLSVFETMYTLYNFILLCTKQLLQTSSIYYSPSKYLNVYCLLGSAACVV